MGKRPRCPDCDRAARGLYIRPHSDEPIQRKENAWECPDCGCVLTSGVVLEPEEPA